MKKHNQSSIVDFLMQRGTFTLNGMNVISINSNQAKNLYSIFVSAMSEDGHIKMAKPLAMPTTDFIELQMAGLIAGDTSNVHITKNGSKLLEKMILSDDDCTFALKTNIGGQSMNKSSIESHQEGLLPRTAGIFRL